MSSPAPTDVQPGWTGSMRLAFVFLLGVLCTLLVQQAAERFWGARPLSTSVTSSNATLDLNRATEHELRQIPGIGPNLAERIVEKRAERGRFQSLDELREVPGIGPSTYQRLQNHLVIGIEDAEPPTPLPGPPPIPVERSSSQKTLPEKAIELNTATKEELMKLPGIGVILADRILEERVRSPFRQPADLTRIKGIKGKTLEKLLPYVYVGNPPQPGI